jgi:hypothetical protein
MLRIEKNKKFELRRTFYSGNVIWFRFTEIWYNLLNFGSVYSDLGVNYDNLVWD